MGDEERDTAVEELLAATVFKLRDQRDTAQAMVEEQRKLLRECSDEVARLHSANLDLQELLDRWVYGNASTEDLRQLCADTAAALPSDSRPTRYDQVAGALAEMMDAAAKRSKT